MPLIGRHVVGLDAGSWSVKAVEIKAGLRSFELVRFEEQRLPHDAPAAERLAKLRDFLAEHAFPTEYLVAAYPAQGVTHRHVRFPFVGSKRVSQALGFEIEEALPFPIHGSVLTWEQAQTGEAQTAAVGILAPRDELREHLEGLAEAGGDPRVLEVEGTSLGNLASAWDDLAGGRVALDVGHSKTNVCLLVDGAPVLLRSIPVAGAHLTEAVAKQQRLGWDAAESHKHANGIFEGSGTQPAAPEIAALLDRLAREVARSLQSAVSDPLAAIAPEEIVLVGGSSAIPGLPTYLEERIDLPCRVLGAASAEAGLEDLPPERVPAFAQATALALRGAPSARRTRADFRQAELRYAPDLSGMQGQLRLTAGLFALALLLWITSLGSNLVATQSRARTAEAQLDHIYTQVFPTQAPPDDPAGALEAELESMRELAAHLGVMGRGLTVLEILRLIAPQLPDNDDVRFAELRIERNTVRAQGLAKTFEGLDRARELLADVEAFEQVILSDVAKVPKHPLHRFSMTIQLGGPGE